MFNHHPVFSMLFVYVFAKKKISKRINPTTTFMALNSCNEPTTNFIHQRVHNSPISQLTAQPRRSWSNFAFNNKNFPDGKLSYESQSVRGGPVAINDRSSWKAGEGLIGDRLRDGKERQDVMARASQIVM